MQTSTIRFARRATTTGAAILGLAASAACGSDAVGPPSTRFDATFVLESVNGRPLPVSMPMASGVAQVVVADTLRFARSGLVTRSYAFRFEGIRHEEAAGSSVLPYSVRGTQLTIGDASPCRDTMNCIGYEQGELDAAGATVRGRMLWHIDEPMLRYRRVP